MKIITTYILLLAFVVGSYGRYWPCMNLSGTWRNQLGSNMTIETIGDSHRITGQYNTSVESSAGASTISSKISGIVQNVGNGSLIAFNVLWNRGASITAWVGQCIVCDGEAKLYTTWVLRSLQTPRKRWMSTRINQDTFWRVDDIPQSEQQSPSEDGTQNSDILRKWSSVTGDSFDFNQALESGGFEGTHSHGSVSGGALYGRFDGNQTYSAFGFAAAHPTEVKGWTGHIYNAQEPNSAMETSWLQHAFSSQCNDPRKFVKYGMEDYKKDAVQEE
ncbi:hypothetical protein JTE90_010741 [Oedothorax gibbosus]|uniref:Uncharacterized protein n=1 Tax=Oedothorax gibbosus TaxID=931172 RepID=A0AAV6UEX1_9ARAC|nr:hypothetical protein JTE90_010741 [Oedothorax gibbosus]